MIVDTLPPAARSKLDLMFEGIRYSDALGRAAEHSFPNYYPYRFSKDEHDPTGSGKATIPYLLTTDDGTLVRIKGNGSSPWSVSGSLEEGYRLTRDGNDESLDIRFQPLPDWMSRQTSDGFPMAQAGISLHGDMLVINVAPGCEYFLAKKQDGISMRCTFCSYGAPDERTRHLGQLAGLVPIPELTCKHMQETLLCALEENDIRHIYLVGGSMRDWHEEGERFIGLARSVQEVNKHRVPVTCGSGALPDDILLQLHGEGLVENVCFNLEVWSEPLFSSICPGKNNYVGYHRWIESLESAVGLWSRGHVYSAMVAGIELEPEHGLDWEQAAELAIEGAGDLCSRGILPVYSLYWPLGGRDHPEYFSRLRNYFEKLNLSCYDIRQKYELGIDPGFMCHRCAYMQIECDIDRVAAHPGEAQA